MAKGHGEEICKHKAENIRSQEAIESAVRGSGSKKPATALQLQRDAGASKRLGLFGLVLSVGVVGFRVGLP